MNEPTSHEKFFWKDFSHFMVLVMLRDHCNKQPNAAEYTKALVDSWLERANAHVDSQAVVKGNDMSSVLAMLQGALSEEDVQKARAAAKTVADTAMNVINTP